MSGSNYCFFFCSLQLLPLVCLCEQSCTCSSPHSAEVWGALHFVHVTQYGAWQYLFTANIGMLLESHICMSLAQPTNLMHQQPCVVVSLASTSLTWPNQIDNHYWGEPERAPHIHVLTMSICAMLKVCFLLATVVHTYRVSFCVVERRAVMGRSWVWTSQIQLLFFGDRYCKRAITSRSWVQVSHGQLLIFYALQKRLWVLQGCFMNILTCCE